MKLVKAVDERAERKKVFEWTEAVNVRVVEENARLTSEMMSALAPTCVEKKLIVTYV